MLLTRDVTISPFAIDPPFTITIDPPFTIDHNYNRSMVIISLIDIACSISKSFSSPPSRAEYLILEQEKKVKETVENLIRTSSVAFQLRVPSQYPKVPIKDGKEIFSKLFILFRMEKRRKSA